MDITHFAFAFYVFLLVCVTLWLYGRITRGGKKGAVAREKEQHLFKLYQNIEDMLGGFEEYAEEAKAALDERLKRAEELLAQAHAAGECAPGASQSTIWEFLAQAQSPAEAGAAPAPRGRAKGKPAPKTVKTVIENESAAEAAAGGKSSFAPKAAAKKPAGGKRAPESAKEPPRADAEAEAPKGAESTAKKPRKSDEIIRQYIEAGMSKEEIARTMGISIREVLLIMELKNIGMAGSQR